MESRPTENKISSPPIKLNKETTKAKNVDIRFKPYDLQKPSDSPSFSSRHLGRVGFGGNFWESSNFSVIAIFFTKSKGFKIARNNFCEVKNRTVEIDECRDP